MRKILFAVLTATQALLLPAYAQPFDDARFCQAMQEIVVNKEMSSKLDEDAKHIAVTVHCDAKIVHFKMRLGVPDYDLREHKQALWNQHCNGPVRAAIDNGWIVALTTSSTDGVHRYIRAECGGDPRW
jgi:hypothetical protein